MIDKQKTSENVYFLNTVTTDDLLPLAEQGKEPPQEVTPEPEPKPIEPVEEVPEPEPEKKDSPLLSMLLIGAVAVSYTHLDVYKRQVPDLNVYENIVLLIELDGGYVDEKFIGELLDMLHLQEKAEALPGTLSGGQQQRCLLYTSRCV